MSGIKHTGRVGFISLGCAKATVDSERILTGLRVRGYEIADTFESADIVMVNTCGFIEAAIDESLDAIAEAVDRNGQVLVTGCLGARRDLIEKRFPQLLAITGPQSTEQVLNVIDRILPRRHEPYLDVVPPGGIKLTPRHYAYVKISEGCNNHCTFCIIPQLRGRLVSRAANQILEEAEALVSAGVKELLLVSQDSSAYGSDLGYRQSFHGTKPLKSNLIELSKELGKLGIWIRLHYLYPYPHIDRLLPMMCSGEILPYLDVPFQHASPSILKAMNRPAHKEIITERISNWRSLCPDIVLRSTFIVGFPGETEADFDSLLDFLDEAQFNRVGCFAYSAVDGAAANEFPDHVPEEIKNERLERFMQKQAEISYRLQKKKVGKVYEVMIDSVDDARMIARTKGDAPEVDGVVEIDSVIEGVSPGDRIEVRITGCDTHDLFAQPIENQSMP